MTSLDESPGIDEDLFAPAVIEDPYRYYGHLREVDPVHWNARHEVWIVTRYDDVTWLTLHPELFSSAVPQNDPRPPYPPIRPDDAEDFAYVMDQLNGRIVTTDRPEHRVRRGTLHPFFARGSMEQWRPMIREAVGRLLDGVQTSGPRADLMNEFAIPLPLLVIAEMMAIPEADRPYVREIAQRMLVGPLISARRMNDVADSMKRLDSYITPILEERFHNPGEDLISILLSGEHAGVFTREQVLRNISFLLVAGHETTINMICNGMLAFIQNPGQWERLRSDPRGLCGTATEECLRYEPPVLSIERLATQDIELRGKQIRALDRVRWFISSANRDPERFPDPDTFDIGRSPNPHVGFGYGIHRCLGATLARIEGEEVFSALAERFGSFELATDSVEYAPAIHLRSLTSLQVTWTAP